MTIFPPSSGGQLATFTETISAPLATPTVFPAMTEATEVPWPALYVRPGSSFPVKPPHGFVEEKLSFEKLTPSSTRETPGVLINSEWFFATPVSTTYTLTPFPVSQYV